MAGTDPVVLTGDFNTTPDSAAYRLLTGTLKDARTLAPATGPEATFHNFTGRPDRRIDWILVRDATLKRVDSQPNGGLRSANVFGRLNWWLSVIPQL